MSQFLKSHWPRLTRDGLSFALGLVMIGSQTVRAFSGDPADAQIVTGGIALILAPGVLYAGLKKRDES